MIFGGVGIGSGAFDPFGKTSTPFRGHDCEGQKWDKEQKNAICARLILSCDPSAQKGIGGSINARLSVIYHCCGQKTTSLIVIVSFETTSLIVIVSFKTADCC